MTAPPDRLHKIPYYEHTGNIYCDVGHQLL